MCPRFSSELVAYPVGSAKHTLGTFALRGSGLSGRMDISLFNLFRATPKAAGTFCIMVTGTISSTVKVIENKVPVCQTN